MVGEREGRVSEGGVDEWWVGEKESGRGWG